MRERSLSAHLLTWILPFTLGVSFLISVSNYLIARHTIVQQLEYGVQRDAQAAASQVKGLWDQYHNDVITISQSPLFRDYVMNREFGLDQEAGVYRREIEKMLRNFSRRSGAFPRIRFLDLRGREICRVQEDGALKPSAAPDPEAASVLPRLKPGEPAVSRLRREAWHRWPTVSWTIGVFDEGGKVRGAVAFDASLGPTYEALGRFHIGESGSAHLVEEGGPSAPGRAVAAAPVSRTPWTVVLTVDRGEFVGPLWRLSMASLLLALLAAVLLALGLSRQLRYLLKPIAVLADAASAFAEGALETRVEVSSPREVGVLAKAFNAMAASLKQRTEDLVQRVRELTALHHMNDVVLRQLGSRTAIGKICLEAVVDGLGFHRGGLFLIHQDRGLLVGECARGMQSLGMTDDEFRSIRIPLDGPDILAQAARGRSTIHVEDARKDARCDQEIVARFKTRAFCAAPILSRGRVIALMTVSFGDSRPIPQAMIRSFGLFCSAVGVALENARLIEDTVVSEERYRTAVENSPHAVIGLDQNLRVTLWNRRSEALFGYQPSEAAGRTLTFVFDEQDYQALKRRVETAGAVRQAEVKGITRDGRSLDLNVSWTGQSAPAGAREWFIVIQDETEKKRLLSRLIQSEKLSAVGRLIAGVAHELNNPLTAVAGFAEILHDGPPSPQDREDIRLLHANALRCRDIIQGLLSFVRQRPKKVERVSLNYLVEASVSLLEYRLVRAEGIALELDLDPAAPQAGGDFSKLQQVLVNLLSNAGDALKGRAGRRMIRVRTRVAAGGCEVVVEDNGPGVPRHLRERVFEPFFTTKPLEAGTGLGLSISAQVVAESGGALRCEEGPEGGACFVMRLPLCPAGVEEAQSALSLPPSCPGAKVLIVDDEPEVAQLMSRLLGMDGIKVMTVVDEPSARRALAREAWDLVVADVDLGPAKGFDLMGAGGQAGRTPAFLFVTGDVLNDEFRRRAAELDASLLSKPFLRTDFLRAVRRALVSEAGQAKSRN